MAKYQKKPLVIDAYQYNGNFVDAPGWIADAILDNVIFVMHDKHYNNRSTHIRTLEGDHIVSFGDYIIRGIKGELYPCKPDIFEMSYDLAESE